MNSIQTILKQHSAILSVGLAFLIIALLQVVRYSYDQVSSSHQQMQKIASQAKNVGTYQVSYDPNAEAEIAQKILDRCQAQYSQAPHLVKQCVQIISTQQNRNPQNRPAITY